MMKWKRLWISIKNYINGMKVLKLQKEKIILMLKNLNKIISNGYLIQIKKQKLDNDANGEDNSINLTGDGVIITDRNSLLEKLKNMK